MFRFHKLYALLTILLFLVEVVIALFIRDRFIRPYVGDVLVVILIYCFVCSFVKIPLWFGAIGVLLFAYTIELLQYFKFVEVIGFQNSHVAKVVLGNSFSWMDIVAYTVGIIIVVLLEQLHSRKLNDDRISS